MQYAIAFDHVTHLLYAYRGPLPTSNARDVFDRSSAYHQEQAWADQMAEDRHFVLELPADLAKEFGSEFWTVPAGRLLQLLARHKERTDADHAREIGAFAARHFSGWKAEPEFDVAEAVAWSRKLDRAKLEMVAVARAMPFRVEHANALALISTMAREVADPPVQNVVNIRLSAAAAADFGRGELHLPAGYALSLVADDETARDPDLADRLRALAARYLFGAVIDVEGVDATGVEYALKVGDYLDVGEALELASRHGAVEFPGSVHLSPWDRGSCWSEHTEHEYRLHVYETGDDGERLELGFLIGSKWAYGVKLHRMSHSVDEFETPAAHSLA